MAILLPQRAMRALEFYFPGQFQFTLPPEWIAIILHATGIGPVGASRYKYQPIQVSELPP
jgi:hypothetical protein